MTIRKLCVNEITISGRSYAGTITCTPSQTPIDIGNECQVSLVGYTLNLGVSPPVLSFTFNTNYEYIFNDGITNMEDFCFSQNNSGSVTLSTSSNTTCSGALAAVTYCLTCTPYTTTASPKQVTGLVNFAFTVDNLMSPTIICISDTVCP